MSRADRLSPPLPPVTMRVGVSGHRPNRLGRSDPGLLGEQIRRVLAVIQRAAGATATLRVLSSLAEGADRLVASAATRLGPVDGADLAPTDRAKWRQLRGSLDGRQATRTLGRRFRQDPVAYLRSIEESLIRKTLPC